MLFRIYYISNKASKGFNKTAIYSLYCFQLDFKPYFSSRSDYKRWGEFDRKVYRQTNITSSLVRGSKWNQTVHSQYVNKVAFLPSQVASGGRGTPFVPLHTSINLIN